MASTIKRGAEWFLQTLSGRGNAQEKGDVPGLIAKWLFRIGAVGAIILVPVTVIFSFIELGFLVGSLVNHGLFKSMDRSLVICPLLLSGYAVWIGWGWRSREVKSITFRVLFWAASATFNLIIPFLAWKNEHTLWIMFMPNVLWPILASAASLVALFFEFGLSPREVNL